MNTDEQSLIDGLFTRLKQAEAEGGARDAQADERIKGHVANQPAAAYYMAQAILVQEAAIKRLSEQNKQLQADLQQARSQAQSPAPQQSGGFLSSIFGGGNRDVQPAQPAQPSGSGWREPSRQAPAYQPPPQQNYAPQGQAPAGGGFMRGALQTAAGVAGGVMLAEGISSLFHHNNPQEIVEVIKEEPAQAADTGGWNDTADNQQVSNDSWNDQGGLADTDYDSGGDEGGFFSNDDDYV
jgi:hypothetical protein